MTKLITAKKQEVVPLVLDEKEKGIIGTIDRELAHLIGTSNIDHHCVQSTLYKHHEVQISVLNGLLSTIKEAEEEFFGTSDPNLTPEQRALETTKRYAKQLFGKEDADDENNISRARELESKHEDMGSNYPIFSIQYDLELVQFAIAADEISKLVLVRLAMTDWEEKTAALSKLFQEYFASKMLDQLIKDDTPAGVAVYELAMDDEVSMDQLIKPLEVLEEQISAISALEQDEQMKVAEIKDLLLGYVEVERAVHPVAENIAPSLMLPEMETIDRASTRAQGDQEG